MLCHVIGFTDFEHHGIQGVEGSLDDYLRGQDAIATSSITALARSLCSTAPGAGAA